MARPLTGTCEFLKEAEMAEVKMMDGEAVHRAVRRIAHEIAERQAQGNVALVGIQTRGVPLAHRLAKEFKLIEGGGVLPVGSLDISFHRDDLAQNVPVPKGSEVLFDLQGKTVILVDDVLFTGRTIRAALDALCDLGRPKIIQLAVLVDRGHRELPIRPDYIGKNLPTAAQEKVRVRLMEVDGEDAVILENGSG
jgi:pyrimidine operon attenuation protein/uracil phosphoribosyltransferase